MGVASRQSDVELIVHKEHDIDIHQFDFDLPERLIAQYPASERSQSRLLVVGREQGQLTELRFSQLGQVLRAGDLLVCNDSRVIPARLEARKPTGGRVEILVERIESESQLQAQLKARRPIKTGDSIVLDQQFNLTAIGRKRDLFVLQTDQGVSVRSIIERCGSVPLPPYISRPVEAEDRIRYQNVYARHDGSVAAPTAGLHFSEEMIEELELAGVEIQYVTLHVGAGTFAPIRSDDITRHRLHSEVCQVSKSVCDAVEQTLLRDGRVIAVGTTTVRVLETAAQGGSLQPYNGETDLFIRQGFRFRVVDGLITNFHLPKSTLLMLVSAFGGLERVSAAYRFAVKQEFRFYSYGDAMFVDRIAEL